MTSNADLAASLWLAGGRCETFTSECLQRFRRAPNKVCARHDAADGAGRLVGSDAAQQLPRLARGRRGIHARARIPPLHVQALRRRGQVHVLQCGGYELLRAVPLAGQACVGRGQRARQVGQRGPALLQRGAVPVPGAVLQQAGRHSCMDLCCALALLALPEAHAGPCAQCRMLHIQALAPWPQAAC